MSTPQFTFEDLRRILFEGAGAAEGVTASGDTVDTTFEALGYDSLALLETGSRIEREFAITLDESAVTQAVTPRDLIAVVNSHLSVTSRTSA